jgi:hypothetical protein
MLISINQIHRSHWFVNYIYIYLVGDRSWGLGGFFNNQLKSITKMYRLLATTTSYDVDVWSRGTNRVIMNIHKNGIIIEGSSHKSVIVITLTYALPILNQVIK